MGVVEKLNQIKSCKESIKQAIINKGVDMEGVAFEGYADKINEISGGASDDTEYIEFDKAVHYESMGAVPNCIQLKFATPNLEYGTDPNTGNSTWSGGGHLLTIALYSENGNLTTGTYTANEGNNQVNPHQFNIGGDVDMGGWTTHTGTYFEILPDSLGTPTDITDGTIDVKVEGDKLVIKLKSSVINARIQCPLSECPFDVVVYDPTDYLTMRKNITSYSSVELNIPDGAFYGMGITEVSLPNAYAIPTDVFNNCTNLTTVDLPNVMSFGQRVFYNCSSLQSIDLPLLTDAGGESFQGCSSLSSVNLPKCQTVGGNVFFQCSSLQSIDLPECVFVGLDAFNQCSNLETVNLPKCTTVESQAFMSTSLSEINLPECTNICQNAFQGIMNLGTADIPKCKEIGSAAFSGCENLLSVIATDCEKIFDMAFMGAGLGGINLLKCGRIGAMAFAWCNNLTSVYAPNCAEIAGGAFQGCQALTELDLSNVYYCSISDLSVFDMTPFMNGEGTIKVHSSSLAFYQANSPWIELSERLVGTGDPDVVLLAIDSDGKVYGETTGLYDNYLGFLAIGNDAVISIDLPNASNAPYIQYYPNLQSINLGKLNTTQTGQFCDNSALTTVNLPECTTVNNETFIRCFNLTTVNLPKCTFVSDWAFGECVNLTAIDLPECTFVGSNIFTNCTALESVSLPKCSGFGSGVFSGCNNLKTLTLSEYEGVSMLFEPLPESIEKIYVNPSYVENYKSDWFWGQYADKIFAAE